MSPTAAAIPKSSPSPKVFAIPDGPFLVIHSSVLRACGGYDDLDAGDHDQAAVLGALIFRAEKFGCFLRLSLAYLRTLAMNVAGERTVRKILGELEDLGYLTVEDSDPGDWLGLKITLHRDAIQNALDRAAVKPPQSATTVTPAKAQSLTPANLHPYKSSASKTECISPPTPPLNPTSPTVEQEEKPFHEGKSTPEPQSSPTPEAIRIPPNEPPPAAAEMSAVPAKSIQKPTLVEFPTIPPRVFPHDARAEIRHQFSERFKFSMPFYDLDYIEMGVTARGRTLEEYYSLIARHWAVSTPKNPVGFAKWFAMYRMGEVSPQPHQQIFTFVESPRCPKCKGGGYITADQLCDCPMGKDLDRDRVRQAKKQHENPTKQEFGRH